MPLLRVRHSISLNEVLLLIIGTGFLRSSFKPHVVIFDPHFPWLEDTVEDGVVDGTAQLLDTKFLTGFDLATTLSS